MAFHHFNYSYFLFNETVPTEIYTLSLHDALPICGHWDREPQPGGDGRVDRVLCEHAGVADGGGSGVELHGAGAAGERSMYRDRKSTRLNSSHRCISYAVFCLKKKNKMKRKLYMNR